MSYEERINHLKDEFSKTSHKLRMADVEGSHTDTCTKCTVKPIVKEHMCDECYTEHVEWLTELSANKCTYCEQESKYQQGSYNLCQRCADKVNNLILGKTKQDDDQWYTLYESGVRGW